jgi:hypothetical protein
VVILQANADLLQIVDALRPPRGFTGSLYRRQQERHQNADNRDHDQ